MGASQQVNSDRAPQSARRAALPPFKDLFCTYTHSPLESFELTLFKKSLYPHARLIAPILLRLKRQWFAEDLDVIRELATVDSQLLGADLLQTRRLCGLRSGARRGS